MEGARKLCGDRRHRGARGRRQLLPVRQQNRVETATNAGLLVAGDRSRPAYLRNILGRMTVSYAQLSREGLRPRFFAIIGTVNQQRRAAPRACAYIHRSNFRSRSNLCIGPPAGLPPHCAAISDDVDDEMRGPRPRSFGRQRDRTRRAGAAVLGLPSA
jgi:hypothetical protein